MAASVFFFGFDLSCKLAGFLLSEEVTYLGAMVCKAGEVESRLQMVKKRMLLKYNPAPG